jgi:hypothetical protein
MQRLTPLPLTSSAFAHRLSERHIREILPARCSETLYSSTQPGYRNLWQITDEKPHALPTHLSRSTALTFLPLRNHRLAHDPFLRIPSVLDHSIALLVVETNSYRRERRPPMDKVPARESTYEVFILWH